MRKAAVYFNGEFAGTLTTKYRKRFHPSKVDFVEFGKRIGVSERRIEKLLAPFLEKQPLVDSLTSRSFLDERSKRGYLLAYNTRRNYLIGRHEPL
jgi:serine/threonine-protein kinase HipA